MSVTKRIAFGAAASWFSRGVSIVLGLVLMPVLFRHLPKEELGVWLLLGQSWAALGILDLGFGVTLTRRIALAKGKSGGDPNAVLTDQTRREIADLVECGRRIYRIMAVGVFGVSWVLGFFYLRGLDLHGLSHGTVWIAWTILCACQALNVWANIWNCLLQGVGYIGWDAIISSFISAGMLIGQIIAVLCGGGLVSLAVIAAVAVIFQRALTRGFARSRRPELFALRGSWNREVLKGMASLAVRAWLTAVGTILVFNTDQFFIASAKGAENIPAFRAAYVLVHNLTVLAVSLAGSSIVFISHLWQSSDLRQVHRIVERNCRLGLLIMLFSAAVLAVTGRELFNVWLGTGNFVGFAVLGVFILYETLEAQSYIIATSSRATEHEAFAVSSLFAGVLKIGLSFWFMNQWGLLGLACATLLSLALTNHWYFVFRGLLRLQLSIGGYLRTVLLPAALWFAVACVLAYAVRFALGPVTDWTRLLSVTAAVGLLFVIALWISVLSPHERSRVQGKLFRMTRRAPAT